MYKQETINPADLLLRTRTQFARMNPRGQGDLMGVSLLEAGHHIGINTVGQDLRNANLQLFRTRKSSDECRTMEQHYYGT